VTQSIRIRAGNSEAVVLPETGGCIGGWRFAGQDILRRALTDGDPLATASFPLVPYSNRIADARFRWREQDVHLTPNPIALPHAIHGVGWQRRWHVRAAQPNAAHIELRHGGDADWPWAFHAEQRFSVSNDSLYLQLSVTNHADSPAPLAFGHHIYCDNRNAYLNFRAQCLYPVDADGLPTDAVALSADTDFSIGRAVAGTGFDNLFGRWDCAAQIGWTDRPYALHIESDLPHAILYTPPGADYFCFEPVPHISNALNRADNDMPVILPGAAFEAYIRFTATPAR
jgi:aldose 1-epimerase